MNTAARLTVVVLCLGFLPAPALALDADVLGLVPRSKVQVGQKLELVLTPTITLKRVSVLLQPEGGGTAIRLQSGRIGLGGSKALQFVHPIGKRTWTASFSVVTGSGEKGTFVITLETEVFPQIDWSISKEDIHLEERYLTLKLNQPAAKVDLQVLGTNGKQIHEDTTEFADEAAGTPLRVEWEQPEGVGVLKMNIRAWSSFGFWKAMEVTVYEDHIPHEDVVFDTGKSVIRSDQAPKIDKTIGLLNEKIRKFGGLIKLQLYVAGYTDRVGPVSANQTLSESRARSIAAYFRRKGIRIPVYYQGFGELVLAVKTPDETAEPRNRRAVYVLSSSPPKTQAQIPRAAWKKL